MISPLETEAGYTSPMQPLYRQVAVVDFETYYEKERGGYSLKNPALSMTDYIRHPSFQAQTASVWLEGWPKPVTVAGHDEIQDLLNEVDWSTTAFCAHHCQFDGLIAAEHFGIQPCAWVDTISMFRMLHGVDVNAGLAYVGPFYGFEGKAKVKALEDVSGKRLEEIPDDLLRLLMEYNESDTFQTMGVYRKMRPHIPDAEMRVIDLTISMYTEPMLELNEQRLQALHRREVDRRAETIGAAGVEKAILGSAQRFADHLRSLGVEPPTKISPKTGEPAYAFAKTDLDFQALRKHPNEQVRAAVEARLCAKSALIEDRSQRLLRRVGLPTPMYYNYWAARTGRWGGGDSVNWQNLSKKGDGAELRKSLEAPDGMAMIIADASQIEARMVAWLADHGAKIAAFVRGDDIYAVGATGVYGYEVNKDDNPEERFAGKVLELSCQYGSGGAKVSKVFRLGLMGPAVDISIAEATELVKRWRIANRPITDLWKTLESCAEHAWLQGTPSEYKCLGFELYKGNGYIHLPNGTYMIYRDVGWDANTRSMYYNSRNGHVKIWGGYLLENVSQALSCVALKQQMLRMMDEIVDVKIAATTHDEVVNLVYEEEAERHARTVHRIMSTPEDWALGLPLNAEVTISKIYSKV